MIVDLAPVLVGVSVVVVFVVVNGWRNPYCIESEILNVLKLLLNSSPVSSAVCRDVAWGCDITIASPESVSQQLVDCSSLPCRLISSQDTREEQ